MKAHGFAVVMISLLAAACSTPPAQPPASQAPAPTATPAKPNVNLSGYPAEFRQGYADGCNSAKGSLVRNDTRMKGDIQYAAGWRDGNDICRKR